MIQHLAPVTAVVLKNAGRMGCTPSEPTAAKNKSRKQWLRRWRRRWGAVMGSIAPREHVPAGVIHAKAFLTRKQTSLDTWAAISARLFRTTRQKVGPQYGSVSGAAYLIIRSMRSRFRTHFFLPPQLPIYSWAHGWHVKAVVRHIDPITFRSAYVEDAADIIPLGFFVRGEPYDLWSLFAWDRHFFGIDKAAYNTASGHMPTFYLLGADKYGRDLLSRILYGARVSLSVRSKHGGVDGYR